MTDNFNETRIRVGTYVNNKFVKPSLLFISISHGNAVEYKRINENATIKDLL